MFWSFDSEDRHERFGCFRQDVVLDSTTLPDFLSCINSSELLVEYAQIEGGIDDSDFAADTLDFLAVETDLEVLQKTLTAMEISKEDIDTYKSY